MLIVAIINIGCRRKTFNPYRSRDVFIDVLKEALLVGSSALAGQKVYQQESQRGDQQQVYQAAADIAEEPDEPEKEQNDDHYPQHAFFYPQT